MEKKEIEEIKEFLKEFDEIDSKFAQAIARLQRIRTDLLMLCDKLEKWSAEGGT